MLLTFGLIYAALATGFGTLPSGPHEVWHATACAIVGATWTVGLSTRRGPVWVRAAVPGGLMFALAVSQLVLFDAPTKDPWFNLNVAAAAIAFLLSWDAMRIDAVRALEAETEATALASEASGTRERIAPLALPAARRVVTTIGLIASAGLLFITIVLDLF